MNRLCFSTALFLACLTGLTDCSDPAMPGPESMNDGSTDDARVEADTGVTADDAAAADAERMDGGMEAGLPDTGIPDAYALDAASMDARAQDGATIDARAQDSAPIDAPIDAARLDAALVDARADAADAASGSATDASLDAACGGDGSACTGGRIISLALGTSHSCALRDNGRVLCWGNNARGQLGDGTLGAGGATPRQVQDISTATSIWAGSYATCATLADESSVCWGDGNSGQFGLPIAVYRSRPVAITTPAPARMFVFGDAFACALLSDRTVACSGANFFDQLGTGSSLTEPVSAFSRVPGLTGILDLAAGAEHACALRGDRTVVCWGRNNYLQVAPSGAERRTPSEVLFVSNVTAISAGGYRSCALSEDGSSRCWGDVSPTFSSGVRTISAGTGSVCAVYRDGTVACAGYNSFGQVGDGTTMPRTMPVPITVHQLNPHVFAGFVHNCALHIDGRIECWGSNETQQLGISAPDTCRAFGSDVSCATRPTLIPEF